MRTLAMIAVALAIPTAAYAQDDNRPVGGVGGALGGAAVGAAVGGPVGAVVGAGIGTIVGSSLPQEPSVVYNGPIVVGEPLPQSVVIYPLPQYPD
jgi:outer membrane lipoprotein SlyB